MSRLFAFLAGGLVGLALQSLRRIHCAPDPHGPAEQPAYNPRMRQR